MTFPQSISEKALLDCQRSCCICHKFCGFKIELHHIFQKAEGGEDTYENCIPLCLDCHAEVKAYDHKHPKGRKYTESELKQHRDRWYDKVRNQTPIVVHPEYVGLDQKLFLKIREIFPGKKGSISFVKNNCYATPFLTKAHQDLQQYLFECEDPAFEFIDADLEIHRSQLTDAIENFLRIINQVAFATKISEYDIEMAIYPEIKYTKPEIYYEAIKNVDDAANKLCFAYDNLVRLGRRKLAVE
ncbi:HNH endonuclease [Phormidium nigroviride]